MSLLFVLLSAGCPQPTAVQGVEPRAWLSEQPLIALNNATLGISDRCVSCHHFSQLTTLSAPVPPVGQTERQAIVAPASGPGDPVSVHPGGWLNWHPYQEYGCTPCHGGDGRALSFSDAGHPAAALLENPSGAESNEEQATGRYSYYAPASEPSPPFHSEQLLAGAELYARCGVCHLGNSVPGAPPVTEGRMLIRELNCTGCHQLSEQLAGTHTGPALARCGEKLEPDLIAALAREGSAWKPGSRMPEFRLNDGDARPLALYLATRKLEDVATASPAVSALADLDHGLSLIRDARCANCHALPEPEHIEDDDLLWALAPGRVGPSLVYISARASSDWLLAFLADPQAWYPQTRMPVYDLTADEWRDVAAWLDETSCQYQAPPVAPMMETGPSLVEEARPEAVEQGRSLFVSFGCARCHEAGDELVAPRPIGPSLLEVGLRPWEQLLGEQAQLTSRYEYFSEKLADPALTANAIMPRFDLNDDERTAIAVALSAEQQPVPEQYQRTWSDTAVEYADPEQYAAHYWRRVILPQGAGPTAISRFEHDLSPQACATCHREQYQQWQASRHALAMSPGVTGQLVDWVGSDPAQYESCLRCHARLSEQQQVRRIAGEAPGQRYGPSDAAAWEANPHFIPELYETAHGCANCHLRAHTRHGSDEPFTTYRWDTEQLKAHPLERTPWFKDSEFCQDCHQFPLTQTIADGHAPLENTYEEWRAWAEQAVEPKSCQQCHLPEGEHGFKGIHDADYVRENIELSTTYEASDGSVRASITLVNSNNGHHLPTYVTPKVFLRGYFTDANGQQFADSLQEDIIGREAHIRKKPGGGTEWYDEYDTRIPAGRQHAFTYEGEIPAEAAAFHLEVFVAPDHFYHRNYGKWLKQEKRSAAALSDLQLAWEETQPEASGYFLLEERYEIK